MSGQWRVLLVKDDESQNESIVTTMRKDSYLVHGAISIAEAMRLLWSQEYDVVICDLQMPDVNSLELLQWAATYRPNTRFIIVGPADSEALQLQALETGAVGYLPRPLTVPVLKEELRRLLQQTGFSANLDSFDLLDVIQIINMSRKTIALLVNVGLEERGLLGFREGELVYAEYGLLRGEEAFFALAAHKNGTVVHQLWNEQVTPNVAHPLSRLILQALHYRSRFAHRYQMTGEQVAVSTATSSPPVLPAEQEDDSPFQVLTEYNELDTPFQVVAQTSQMMEDTPAYTMQQQHEDGFNEKEWWQPTGKAHSIHTTSPRTTTSPIGRIPMISHPSAGSRNLDGQGPHTPAQGISGELPSTTPSVPDYRQELPSWLTEPPSSTSMPAMPNMRPATLSGTNHIPATPRRVTPSEWQGPASVGQATGPLVPKEASSALQSLPPPASTGSHTTAQLSGKQIPLVPASPEWVAPGRPSVPLQSLSMTPHNGSATSGLLKREHEAQTLSNGAESSKHPAVRHGYNYDAIVLALQTLGYSVAGFIATAVVTLDGQPIAQVAVDDLDISRVCKHFSTILKSVLQSLDQGVWGMYEDTVITSADRHILMSLVGKEKNAFQVLITTRESDPVESLNVMANIESAITAALQS